MMRRYVTKKNCLVIGICFLLAVITGLQVGFAADKPTGYEEGLKHYQNNEPAKAIVLFKKALAGIYPDQAGKLPSDEKPLLSQLDDEKNAALANYQLGLLRESQGKLDEAATLFRNALILNANGGTKYIGSKKCKMCHMKQYKSWSKTSKAKSFEVLKSGTRPEAKAKLKLDPQKDYTKESKCLACHTTGFGLPGGYKIPEAGDSKSVKRAKANEGVTCEGCHGAASKYITVHKKTMSKKQYSFEEYRQAGQNKAGAPVCATCHNRRNPTAGSDYHFDYEKAKAGNTHENFPLKYRQ